MDVWLAKQVTKMEEGDEKRYFKYFVFVRRRTGNRKQREILFRFTAIRASLRTM